MPKWNGICLIKTLDGLPHPKWPKPIGMHCVGGTLITHGFAALFSELRNTLEAEGGLLEKYYLAIDADEWRLGFVLSYSGGKKVGNFVLTKNKIQLDESEIVDTSQEGDHIGVYPMTEEGFRCASSSCIPLDSALLPVCNPRFDN